MNVSKGCIINQAISAAAVVLKPNDNHTLRMRVVRFMDDIHAQASAPGQIDVKSRSLQRTLLLLPRGKRKKSCVVSADRHFDYRLKGKENGYSLASGGDPLWCPGIKATAEMKNIVVYAAASICDGAKNTVWRRDSREDAT
ncbi:hypothetical protein EYF80_043521 [Liparis tanakae]|uniref:Uncharacterized protein n=1 Tax=Liparis tanakae TaxID=230148 RepID=A0A4Z2G066_9TELE|nr:hypothetical protein EYF80_043521 [Liparis tanakae]